MFHLKFTFNVKFVRMSVEAEFSMSIVSFNDHGQSFWQLIYHSVYFDLTYLISAINRTRFRWSDLLMMKLLLQSSPFSILKRQPH